MQTLVGAGRIGIFLASSRCRRGDRRVSETDQMRCIRPTKISADVRHAAGDAIHELVGVVCGNGGLLV
jgi:hypothetical protein